MAVKFSTCYPLLPQGTGTPCGIVMDRQSGTLVEIICPDLSDELCANLVSKWNENRSLSGDGKGLEDELAQFISSELRGK